MIIHLFNSSSVSGPERLVVPALAGFPESFLIVNLREDRIGALQQRDPLEDYARRLGLPYRSIRVRSRWDRQAVEDLQNLVLELQPDLVHAHAIKASIYLRQAKAQGRRLRCPIVSTHHGVHGLPDLKTRLYEWIYRKIFLKSFDRVLCVSKADFGFLLGSGLSKEKLRLHWNGVNGHRVPEQDRAEESMKARARWLASEPDRDRLFLFGVIGRLSAEKDHDRLLKVLSGLDSLPCEREWKCLIFGTGALETKLRRQAASLGLTRRISWMGYRDQVGNELAGLDLLLSFSKAEGLPINLVEAGWVGTPILATRVGGVEDVIPDQDHGQGIAPEEPVAFTATRLQKVLSAEGQAQLRQQARRLQQRVTSEFTQEKWIQRLFEIYSEMGVRVMRPQAKVNQWA